MLWWKKGPGFSVPGVLFPPYGCCGERLDDQGSLFVQVYPALPVCESGDDPPFIATGDVCRCIPAPSDTARPSSKSQLTFVPPLAGFAGASAEGKRKEQATTNCCWRWCLLAETVKQWQ